MLGIKISRRPNSRASIENAPGPKKRMAVAIASTFMIANLLSNRLGVGRGIHESEYAIALIATSTLAIGVRIPHRRQTLPESVRAIAAYVSNLRSRQPFR